MPRLALALCLLFLVRPALADDDDHNRARDALRDAGILPLAQIMPKVETELQARIIKVEFEDQHGTYRYEFELIDAQGRVSEVMVDARTGSVLGPEEGTD